MLKILVIHGAGPSSYPSGEQKVIEAENAFMVSRGHFVKVLTDRGSFGRNPFKLFHSFKVAQRIRATTLAFKPDIIHFHSVIPYLGLSSLITAKQMGVPVVQTLHNGRWLCVEGGFYREEHYCNDCVGGFGWNGVIMGCGRGRLPALLLFIVNAVARSGGRLFCWVDRFIAVSDFVRVQHIKSGFPVDRIVVNNNGVDVDEFDRAGYAKPWNERSGIAFAGRISIAKGSTVMKHLIPKIKHQFNVIGIGPELNDLKQFCDTTGFKHVKFWGKQTRKKTLEILGSVICTVVPSQCGETFSLVAAESMALSTPVVASDVGGLGDLVHAGGGTVVDAEKYDQFCDAILDYINSPNVAKETGRIGRKFVYEHLASERRGEALLQIYDNLLDQP
jgi:glycosyltransferase involved in cell wall biosynthesis